jgi:hypothetical protein
LIGTAVCVTEEADEGLFVNGPSDHDPDDETVSCPQADLRRVEVEQVPRGRLFCHKAETHVGVSLDNGWCTMKMKRVILACVHLPRRRTVFHTDGHDTIDPDEWDR